MRSRGRIFRVLAAALAACFVAATTGCFGGYNLTRNVYNWNKNVSDSKWIVWLVHLPVYWVSGFVIMADAIVFNSIEFWSGNNPIKVGDSRTYQGPHGEVAELTRISDAEYSARVLDAEGVTHHVRIVREDDRVSAFDAQGRLLAERDL